MRKAIRIFLQTGSHILTKTDWGRIDDDHNARIIVEVASKDFARNILPLFYRSAAKIVELTSFNYEDVRNNFEKYHKA